MYGKLLHAIFYDANFKITAVIKKINKKILYVGIGFIAIAVAVVFLHLGHHGSHGGHHAAHTVGQSFYTTFSTTSKTSYTGSHRIELIPANSKIPLLELHDWFVRIYDQSGQEIQPDKLQIRGAMPEHGHGLPTNPLVENYTDTHGYRITNVSFSMAGNWKFIVEYSYKGVDDGAQFDIEFPIIVKSASSSTEWSEIDKRLLKSLSLHTGRLDKITRGNDVALDNKAALLGHRLFFDKRLSKDSVNACASCHIPSKYFTDGLKKGQGIGELNRNTISIIGSVHQKWQYWDGRRDSLWSQALVPIETAAEMGSDRLSTVRLISDNYAPEYEAIFGKIPAINFDVLPAQASPVANSTAQTAWQTIDLPTRNSINTIFANTGKAIAAYETLLLPKAGRFDEFVNVLLESDGTDTETLNTYLNQSEQRGLRLFISNRTQCLNCHASAMFSNFGFHNIGTAQADDNSIDAGRMTGIQSMQSSEFNCNSIFSSGSDGSCDLLNRTNDQDATLSIEGAFRVPGLRGLKQSAPYMHDGRFAELEDVIRFYTESPPQEPGKRHDLPVIDKLNDSEIDDLAAFLLSLGDQVEASNIWLRPPE